MILKDIEQILKATKKIETIKKAIYKRKKKSKENFNFFHALVTDEKVHLEKYHTNFIAYLLNPKQSHDCDTLFLEKFLRLIGKDHEINRKHYDVVVSINKQTTEGRFIDIVVEYKNEWILFIENKVYSEESENQLQDYYDFCFDKINGKHEIKDKKPIGIFLTLSGYEPSKSEDSGNIIPISYRQIIDWLENCINQLGEKNNLTHSLKQYILALKQILNIMDDEEMKVFQPYLDKNFQEFPSLDVIDSFKNAVIKYSGNYEKRKSFYDKLVNKLFEVLKGEKLVYDSAFYSHSFIVERDSKRYKIIVCSFNEKGKDGGYGGWFGLYLEDDTYIHWQHLVIKDVDDFIDIVEGTQEIIKLGENIDETVNRIVEDISSVIKRYI